MWIFESQHCLTHTRYRDVGVMLTSDRHIQTLNRKYRRQNRPTDILSFPYHKIRVAGRLPRVNHAEDRYLGDMVVSVPYVHRWCLAQHPVVDVEERMLRLLAHGLCHLIGYDHETDEQYEDMIKLENKLLHHVAAVYLS